jgi:hypothetical protein
LLLSFSGILSIILFYVVVVFIFLSLELSLGVSLELDDYLFYLFFRNYSNGYKYNVGSLICPLLTLFLNILPTKLLSDLSLDGLYILETS